ncbi:hypothetical protein AT15_06370 [Kosmotoga arenicorallina S304]|uniref:CN hydrolase domain-containing protein n=1 Tax=Kosmotoga arenicorallina S304 TaxID=1453497 RepID=A0A176JTI4_9BACT|nr:carbon-nitrogen hydrolase family protein [Kosmotoga arenicorallina]OAA26578.1 hypothetical protein AT15_06370 [Kosmotoga arenicorallina S304]
MVSLDITAVQAAIEPNDYTSKKNMKRAFSKYLIDAKRQWSAKFHLAVFPEFLGTFLYPGLFSKINNPQGISKLLLRYVLGNFSFTSPNPFKGAFLKNAIFVERTYREVFSELAEQFNAYIIAPSIFLPEITFESAKGWHITKPNLYNMSYFFNPQGQLLAKIKKQRLTVLETKLIFSGDNEQPQIVTTAFGKVGVLICYDMFFQDIVQAIDVSGVNILAVPSCNFASWKEPTKYFPEKTQEQVWFLHGTIKAGERRENIRYIVNAMAVGKLGKDVAEGRSTIWKDGRLLEIAKSWNKPEVISAYVEI